MDLSELAREGASYRESLCKSDVLSSLYVNRSEEFNIWFSEFPGKEIYKGIKRGVNLFPGELFHVSTEFILNLLEMAAEEDVNWVNKYCTLSEGYARRDYLSFYSEKYNVWITVNLSERQDQVAIEKYKALTNSLRIEMGISDEYIIKYLSKNNKCNKINLKLMRGELLSIDEVKNITEDDLKIYFFSGSIFTGCASGVRAYVYTNDECIGVGEREYPISFSFNNILASAVFPV